MQVSDTFVQMADTSRIRLSAPKKLKDSINGIITGDIPTRSSDRPSIHGQKLRGGTIHPFGSRDDDGS